MVRRRLVVPFALLLVSVSAAGLAAAQGTAPTAAPETVPRFPFATVDVTATLVFGGVAVLVFPGGVRDVVDRVRNAPGVTLGWGVLTLIAVPVAIVLAGVTVIGLLLAVPAIPSFTLYLLTAGAAGKVAVGYLLVARVTRPSLWLGLLAGAALTGALHSIPVVGAVLGGFLWLVGVGAVSRRFYERYRG